MLTKFFLKQKILHNKLTTKLFPNYCNVQVDPFVKSEQTPQHFQNWYILSLLLYEVSNQVPENTCSFAIYNLWKRDVQTWFFWLQYPHLIRNLNKLLLNWMNASNTCLSFNQCLNYSLVLSLVLSKFTTVCQQYLDSLLLK